MAKQKTNTPPTTKAVTLEWVPFESLVFLENNPRTRTDEGKRKMAADIEADPSFYENRPTLANLIDGRYQVYAGDLRAHAAHDVLGWPLIPCAVLDDGTRLLSLTGVYKALGRPIRSTIKEGNRVINMPSFLDANNLQPFVSQEFRAVISPVQ